MHARVGAFVWLLALLDLAGGCGGDSGGSAATQDESTGSDQSTGSDGSGDTGPQPLTCEYLEDPSNCWATAAAELAACLPQGEVGVLAQDRSQCTFSNGAVVQFGPPLPLSNNTLGAFSYTVELDGQMCGSFYDSFQNHMELTAGGVTIVSQLQLVFQLDCGNGEVYETDFSNLFDCASFSQPTDGFNVTETSASFQIWSVSTPGNLFECAI